MKTKLLAMMLLAGSSMFAGPRFSIGVGFGAQRAGFYQAPPAYAANIPPCPGPGYTWVDGYWTNDYGRQVWIAGFWNAPPVFTSYPVAPRFDNRFVGRDDRLGDRDHRQNVARAPRESHANDNRFNGRR